MNKLIRWMALSAACALATGCASVAGGNVQKMHVQAETQEGAAVSGADCVLSNDKGNWKVRSPGDASIVRSNKPMEVKCDKTPLPQGVVSVESATRAAMYGNILVGGVIGAVVDHSSGAAYEYPEAVKVVMGRVTSLAMPKAPAVAGGDPSRPRTGPVPTPAQLAEPPGTGFARLDDADAVPYLGPQGRQAYRDWLGRPAPRAFAMAPGGAYFPAYGLVPQDPTLPSDPAERAVAGCNRYAKTPSCRLYAVNGTVVWRRDAPAASQPALQPAPQPALQPALLATGFARIDDVDAVPLINNAGRISYTDWVARPTPRAFAISPEGHWAATWGLAPADPSHPRDPNERALVICQQRSKGIPCRLYAVNGAVVWTREQAAR